MGNHSFKGVRDPSCRAKNMPVSRVLALRILLSLCRMYPCVLLTPTHLYNHFHANLFQCQKNAKNWLFSLTTIGRSASG